MSDDFVRMVLGELQMHRNQSTDDEPRFSDPGLEHSHKEILSVLSYEEWTDRRIVLQKTGFRKKALKKDIEWLSEHDYVDIRKKPNERRMKQYRKR